MTKHTSDRISASLQRAIADAPQMAGVVYVHVDEIEDNPYQFRVIDENAPEHTDLAASIVEHGVIQPGGARPVSGRKYKGVKYQLAFGHRRLYSSREAAKTKPERAWFPLIVREYSDLEMAEIAVIENVQRQDPSDWVIAQGIKKIFDLSAENGQPLSEAQIAKRLRKTTPEGKESHFSVSYVRNHLAMFKLRPELQEVAQRRSNVRSSLIEIEKLPKDSDAVDELLELVDRPKPLGFRQIKEKVDSAILEAKNKSDSWKAPDAHTQGRQAAFEANGTPNVSRGQRVGGNTPSEAFEVVSTALVELERKLATIEHWSTILSDSKKTKVAPKLKELSTRLGKIAK